VTRPVAAVIPNLNGAGFVGQAVDAALAAGVREVVVVDDGSTDASPDEARRAGARVVPSPGRGFAAAVNHGATHAQGGDLLVLNSDCFLDSIALERLAASLDADARLAVCGARMRERDGSESRSYGRLVTLGTAVRSALGLSSPAPPSVPPTGTHDVPFVPLACALVRAEAWRQLGGLDDAYAFYFEDYDLCWRARQAGWRVGICSDATAVHVGGGSSSRREPQRWFRQYNQSRARYLRKRYPHAWPAYAAVWVPVALARALSWQVRGGENGRAWARSYARSAFVGLGRSEHFRRRG
jgi:GT2 family glycosyltransferase